MGKCRIPLHCHPAAYAANRGVCMMWAEAAFSSLLVFSAILISLSAPPPVSGQSAGWPEFGYLNDASLALSAKMSGSLPNQHFAETLEGVSLPNQQIAESGLASDAAQLAVSEAFFQNSAQNTLDSITAGTPYCLELSAKNYPLHAVSCRGGSPQRSMPNNISSSFSVERAALHNGATLVYSLRQWTDTGR